MIYCYFTSIKFFLKHVVKKHHRTENINTPPPREPYCKSRLQDDIKCPSQITYFSKILQPA